MPKNIPYSKPSLAREFRDNYGMEMPTMTLAKIMYKKHPEAFLNLEDARHALRRIEGKASGSKTKVTHPHGDRPRNPYNLPASYQEKREPFHLPKQCNNILLISDLHIPYHDIEAITVALDYGIENKVNTVFINGDLIDNSQVSRFERDPRKRSAKQEFEATKAFLVTLRSIFPQAEIFWLKGNHCIRWEAFLLRKTPEVWDDPYFTLESRLALHEENIHLLDDKVLVKAGKLSITHGHHIFKGIFVPVSPARGAFLRAKQSIIVGHLHRASHHPEMDLDGHVISCWSTACLCELRPNYSPLVSNSQHGFAHITVEEDGQYNVRNYQIINGKIH